MSQIKYILYSCLLALGLVVAYSIIKPFTDSTWVYSQPTKEEEEEVPGCGFIPLYNKSKVTQHKGETIFRVNCATCHSLSKTLTGPALADVEKRGPWTNRKNLIKWVHSPEKFMKKSAYAKALYKEYNEQLMPSFPHLTSEDIYAIFDYINEVSFLMENN
ncbi:MAG TPA: cytochrome c [Flavisolibacter sp.]|jgi:cytochrome c551/c552|nr:cytochrome c [Flavisolibacter sp.]